jgi:hypothetical protein
VYISTTAFLFFLGFAVLLGYFFAWVYNYRHLHKEPKGKPQRITETVSSPVDFSATIELESMAANRMEQEKTCYETDLANKDAFLKKLLMLFRSRLERESGKVLSICYWVYNGEGFAIRLSNSSYRTRENLFVPKDNRYFSKKEFNWNGIDEAPIDVFHSEELITRSIAGASVSGEGKLHGYISIDSIHENAFDDEICAELRELANVASEVLRTLDLNFRLDRENILFYEMLKGISNLFTAVSKKNLIASLSKLLKDNFKFDRLMIITPTENEKWLISEAIGEQREDLKGVIFKIHERCLLYELLSRKVTTVNETKISRDPYQRRLYENEPENLELRSLFAAMPPMQDHSYQFAIVLESKNNRAVSRIDETMLACIAACASIKLSSIQNKDHSMQEREAELAGIDSNGLGELLTYYKTEFDNLRNSEDSLGILFLKCLPSKEANKAHDFEKFLSILKELKKMWNGRHLAMVGHGEFIFSVKGELREDIFELTAKQIIAMAENLMLEYSLPLKSHIIWLDKNKMANIEKQRQQNFMLLFTISVMNKFREMSEVIE